MTSNIKAVIVTYETDLDQLNLILGIIEGQCGIVVADNSNDLRRSELIAKCVANHSGAYLSMGGNRGIGFAQNKAIAAAWEEGAEAVLLLDDDSIPAVNIVKQLLGCSESLGGAAVVGANALDINGREISNAIRHPGELPQCRDMMSSGTLIMRKIFERVGPFDESLFIDCVDFDWGWRAQQMGIGVYLCRSTAITHRLGEGRIAGIKYPSPIRHYFQYRNILRLMTRSHTPITWRLTQFCKLFTKLLLIFVLMPDKSKRLQFALAGVRDAICGRSGPWPGSVARTAPEIL